MEDKLDLITIHLREEELDINKKWVQTGEITYHKEVLMEEKNITVPILREELIIEKIYTDAASPDQSIRTEIIRIPIKEERVQIKKQTFVLENVRIYKHQLHKKQLIDAILKKEVISFKTTGEVDLETVDMNSGLTNNHLTTSPNEGTP